MWLGSICLQRAHNVDFSYKITCQCHFKTIFFTDIILHWYCKNKKLRYYTLFNSPLLQNMTHYSEIKKEIIFNVYILIITILIESISHETFLKINSNYQPSKYNHDINSKKASTNFFWCAGFSRQETCARHNREVCSVVTAFLFGLFGAILND